MAISITNVLSTGSTTNAASYNTASVTPGANKLMLLAVGNAKASTPDTPTVTGNGLTWVQVATVTFSTVATPTRRLTLFRAMGASPSAGVITIAFGGVTQLSAYWALDTVSGMDTSGTNGSGAVVQSNTNHADTVNNLSISLGAFANSGNATWATYEIQTNNVFTEKSGWTELSDNGIGTTPIRIQTQWIVSNDTGPSATQSATRNWGGLGVEVGAPVTAYTLTAAQGAYTLTGEAAALPIGHTLAVAQGGYVLTGEAVTLTASTTHQFTLSAAQGSYTLTGEPSTFPISHTLPATFGAYTLTGGAALFKVGHTVTATHGSYALTGEAAGLPIGRYLAAGQGAYALTGEAAAFERMIRLAAAQGAYALTGHAVNLIVAGEFDATPIGPVGVATQHGGVTGQASGQTASHGGTVSRASGKVS